MRLKKLLALTILFFGAFFVFFPQASKALSCKCSVPQPGTGSLYGAGLNGNVTLTPVCQALVSDPLFPDSYTDCNQYMAEILTGRNNMHLPSAGLKCEEFSDQACTTAASAPINTDSGELFGEIEADLNTRKPILEVNIPGINFSDVGSSSDANGTYFYIAWIPELITALYKFLLAIVSIVAAAVIVVQGIRVVGSGGGEGKTTAYKKIFQAIIGLFIAWGSYAILYNINPALVQFNALKVKVIEGIHIDDESLADFPETVDTTATGGGTGVIGSLIGAYPSQFAPCSKEGAQYAAQKLHEATICVGPCNCAWTASYFLNYIGCTNIKNGNTTKLEKTLEESGWKRQEITKDTRQKLPVGLLVGPGHVGVSLGNGLQFQSGGNKTDWTDMNKRGGGNCSLGGKGSYADAAACNFCTKVTALRPVVSPGNTEGWSERCARNQVWDKDKIWQTFWTEIIVPPSM